MRVDVLNLAIFIHRPVCFGRRHCEFHSSALSSKKKRKSTCPFASAKKTSKRKKANTFTKDRAEALAASDKGSYFHQEKLLMLEDSCEEDNKVWRTNSDVHRFLPSKSELKRTGFVNLGPFRSQVLYSDNIFFFTLNEYILVIYNF